MSSNLFYASMLSEQSPCLFLGDKFPLDLAGLLKVETTTQGTHAADVRIFKRDDGVRQIGSAGDTIQNPSDSNQVRQIKTFLVAHFWSFHVHTSKPGATSGENSASMVSFGYSGALV